MLACNVSFRSHVYAREPCVFNQTFGCASSSAMWASGFCRGHFNCGGVSVMCGLKDVPIRVTCSCDADRGKARELDAAWIRQERGKPYSGPLQSLPEVETNCRSDAEDRVASRRTTAEASDASSLAQSLLPVMRGCDFMLVGKPDWVQGLHPSERYGEIVHCAGATYLTTRAQLGTTLANFVEQVPCWTTLVRTLDPASGAFRNARLLLPPALHMGHNAAAVCINGSELHVLGGQVQLLGATTSDKAHGARIPQAGVLHTHRRLGTGEPWASPRVALGRSLLHDQGCIERRTTVHAGSGGCQMDGKLSAVFFRGELWLFARANMAPKGGARHVQVSHTPMVDGALGESWSKWQALRFGCEASEATGGLHMGCDIFKENNIYYLNVQVGNAPLPLPRCARRSPTARTMTASFHGHMRR